jgi:predicted SAM-dependent methyltransferase
MRTILVSVARRLLQPGEIAALKTLHTERTIRSAHNRGLRKIRRSNLSRPEKLNLGSGVFLKPGFLNVDLFCGGDVTLDLRRPMPFDANCCELIFSEHFFEHFDYPDVIGGIFRECLRILRPGGILSFSVPDTEWPLTDYPGGPRSPYFQACEKFAWHPRDCTTRMEHINYHFRQEGRHLFAYDSETVQKILGEIGYESITRRPFDPALDSEHRQFGSLFVSARKPA